MPILKNKEEFIAYMHVDRGSTYNILFCGGLGSSMVGGKVSFVENFCNEHKLTFTKFDYYGHGDSSGNFILGTISIWLENVLLIINTFDLNNIIIIGASLGGWLMLLLAQRMPSKIAGLIGLAPAPDFTEDIYNTLNAQQKLNLSNFPLVNYKPDITSGITYSMPSQLILDGKKHLLMQQEHIVLTCPIRILHGLNDKIIDYKKSITLVQKLQSPYDFQLIFNSAEHNMNDPDSMVILCSQLRALAKLEN